MARRFLYWLVSVFFTVLPFSLAVIINCDKKEEYWVKITSNSPEVIYTIVVLSGMTMYDIYIFKRSVSNQTFDILLDSLFVIFLGTEAIGMGLYGGFVANSSSTWHDTAFLAKYYPDSFYVAILVIILGLVTQLAIGVITRNKP